MALYGQAAAHLPQQADEPASASDDFTDDENEDGDADSEELSELQA